MKRVCQGRYCCAYVTIVLITLLAFTKSARAASTMRITAGKSVGTAVLVQQDQRFWILTAYHVIRGFRCTSLESCVQVSIQNRPPKLLFDVTLPKAYIISDLGIVAFEVSKAGETKLSQVGIVPAELVEKKFSDRGASVVAIGNPTIRILDQQSAPFNYVGSGTVGTRSCAKALLPQNVVLPPTAETELIFVDGLSITYGFSGGPLFLENEIDGRVVGIVEGGSKEKSWAVPGELIYERLKNGTEIVIRDDPFQTSGAWPADGFKDTHAYSNVLPYTNPEQNRVVIRDISPLPLPDIPLNAKVTVGITVEFADQATYRKTQIHPRPPAGIVVASLDKNHTANLDYGLLQLEWTVEASRGSPLGIINIPFEIRISDDREPIGRFELPFRVVDTDSISLNLFTGTNYTRADKTNVYSYRLGVETQLRTAIYPEKKVFLVPRLALGVAVLNANQKNYFPDGHDINEHSETYNPGIYFDALMQVRVLRETLSYGLATGLSYESFRDKTRNGLNDHSELTRVSVPLEGFVAIRGLALRPRLSYYFKNAKYNNRYQSPTELTPVTASPSLGVGLDFGGELWF